MNERCRGCGAFLQREAPERPGYLPPQVEAGDGKICRRCYRLTHYGKSDGRPLTAAEAARGAAKAFEPAGVVVVLTDLGDFHGSLPPPGLLPRDKPVILVVNKMDLLPSKAVPREVKAWAEARWREAARGPKAAAVLTLSAAAGNGLSLLVSAMRKHAGSRRTAAIIGATSVGKSTLMRRLLPKDLALKPTVSRFPGTTVAASRWHLEREDLTVYDTPGFVPGDRLTDLLCPDCAAHLVPEKALVGKLFHLNPGQALVMGGFASFTPAANEPRTLLCYTGEGLNIHRTTAAKAPELLASKPDWLLPWACASCRSVPSVEEDVPLEDHEDLALSGLGWVSLRGGDATIRLARPAGVAWQRRPCLFGQRPGRQGQSTKLILGH